MFFCFEFLTTRKGRENIGIEMWFPLLFFISLVTNQGSDFTHNLGMLLREVLKARVSV